MTAEQIKALESFLTIFGNVLVHLLGAMIGVLFYVWIKPFVRKKSTAACVGILYVVLSYVLEVIPWNTSNGIGTVVRAVVIFGVLYFLERRNKEQKFFLVLVYLTIVIITIGISAEVNYSLTELCSRTEFFTSSIPLMIAEYIVQSLLWLFFNLFLLWFAIRLLHRLIRDKQENMTWSELAVQLSPILLVYFMRILRNEYMDLWGQGITYGMIQKNYPGKIIYIFYDVLSYVVILTVLSFSLKIKQQSEGAKETALLEQNRASLETHIEQVEKLYEEQRRLRHDLANHIQTMEGLVRAGETAASKEYLDNMKKELAKGTPDVVTGNPVTDIILGEYKETAEENGITFESGFFYPAGADISAFDLSVILNNALSNAIRAAKQCEKPYIRLSSEQKKNMLLVDVINNFSGELTLNEATGFPEQITGQGIGLKNIGHIAEKYQGTMDIELGERDGNKEFRLTVMLQTGR